MTNSNIATLNFCEWNVRRVQPQQHYSLWIKYKAVHFLHSSMTFRQSLSVLTSQGWRRHIVFSSGCHKKWQFTYGAHLLLFRIWRTNVGPIQSSIEFAYFDRRPILSPLAVQVCILSRFLIADVIDFEELLRYLAHRVSRGWVELLRDLGVACLVRGVTLCPCTSRAYCYYSCHYWLSCVVSCRV